MTNNQSKDIYLEPLSKLKEKMLSTANTKFNIYSKFNTLVLLNMQYEKIAFDNNLKEHPYTLTKDLIVNAYNMFNSFLDIAFIEEDKSIVPVQKSSDVVEKHEELWQKVWAPYDDREMQELIDIRGHRLDANKLTPYFKDKRCVDFGSGNGSFAFALLERGAASVDGIDFGTEQVKRANEAAKFRKVNEKANFSVGSVLKANFEDNSFEFALSNAVFHHLATKEDMETALKEVSRVLKTGSYFWYFVHGSGAIGMDLWDMSVDVLSEVSVDSMKDIIQYMNPGKGKDTYIIDLLTATYIHSSLEETTAMLNRCGFLVIKRLSGADSTSYDLDRVENDPYGVEKFGTGELRLLCRLEK